MASRSFLPLQTTGQFHDKSVKEAELIYKNIEGLATVLVISRLPYSSTN